LNGLKHMRWLRRFLPGWHQRERDFRDWYIALVENFPTATNSEARARYLQALHCVESVKGYREIRYPKMAAARQQVEQLLGQSAPVPSRNSRTGVPPVCR